eukprot:gene15704-21813_t
MPNPAYLHGTGGEAQGSILSMWFDTAKRHVCSFTHLEDLPTPQLFCLQMSQRCKANSQPQLMIKPMLWRGVSTPSHRWYQVPSEQVLKILDLAKARFMSELSVNPTQARNTFLAFGTKDLYGNTWSHPTVLLDYLVEAYNNWDVQAHKPLKAHPSHGPCPRSAGSSPSHGPCPRSAGSPSHGPCPRSAGSPSHGPCPRSAGSSSQLAVQATDPVLDQLAVQATDPVLDQLAVQASWQFKPLTLSSISWQFKPAGSSSQLAVQASWQFKPRTLSLISWQFKPAGSSSHGPCPRSAGSSSQLAVQATDPALDQLAVLHGEITSIKIQLTTIQANMYNVLTFLAQVESNHPRNPSRILAIYPDPQFTIPFTTGPVSASVALLDALQRPLTGYKQLVDCGSQMIFI